MQNNVQEKRAQLKQLRMQQQRMLTKTKPVTGKHSNKLTQDSPGFKNEFAKA